MLVPYCRLHGWLFLDGCVHAKDRWGYPASQPGVSVANPSLVVFRASGTFSNAISHPRAPMFRLFCRNRFLLQWGTEEGVAARAKLNAFAHFFSAVRPKLFSSASSAQV